MTLEVRVGRKDGRHPFDFFSNGNVVYGDRKEKKEERKPLAQICGPVKSEASGETSHDESLSTQFLMSFLIRFLVSPRDKRSITPDFYCFTAYRSHVGGSHGNPGRIPA